MIPSEKIGGFAPNPQGTKRQRNKDSRCNKRTANPERPAATDRPKALWPAPGPSNVASRACPSASSAARYKSKLGSGSDEILKQHTNLVEEYNDYCFYNIKRRRP